MKYNTINTFTMYNFIIHQRTNLNNFPIHTLPSIFTMHNELVYSKFLFFYAYIALTLDYYIYSLELGMLYCVAAKMILQHIEH